MNQHNIKRYFDKFSNLKRRLTKTNFYYRIRDYLFFKEIKLEKKIEKKGDEAIIKYLKKWYKSATGYQLDLNNPVTLTEKQQWVKLYDRSLLKNYCTDKITARDYVAKKIGAEYLIPLIPVDGIYFFDNANDIDFSLLPEKFVIACNHGSSMTIVVEKKSELSKKQIKEIKQRLNRWLKINPVYIGAFDYVYDNIKPKIMITKNLAENNDGLVDYKIMCFNSKAQYFWIDSDRFGAHKRTTYNIDETIANFNMSNYEKSNVPVPKEMEKMIELANILAKEFKFVRIDFYLVNNKIFFGEMTFNSAGGKELPNPIEYNKILGDKLIL